MHLLISYFLYDTHMPFSVFFVFVLYVTVRYLNIYTYMYIRVQF